jgi:hypothetical protein
MDAMSKLLIIRFLYATVMVVMLYACQDPGAGINPPVPSQEGGKPTKYLGVANSIPDPLKLDKCKTLRDVTYLLKDWELNWAKDTVYCLCGDIRVPVNKTLNIAAGVLVRGMTAAASSLTVVPNAQIQATGVANDPIVFTSSETSGSRAPGNWGGVIILGNAQINPAAPAPAGGYVAAGSVLGAAGPPTYGSNTAANNADNSGVFQYVRIEFGGAPVTLISNSERRGLMLGGVGSGTTIDHVQISSGGDDGFSWFGGTVNAKYLLSHKDVDDDFSTEYGFCGKVQFGVASRDPFRADVSLSNGFESENNDAGTVATPMTAAIFSNFTLIGPIQCSSTLYNSLYNDGMHLRRRTQLQVYNVVVTGFPRWQVFVGDVNVIPMLSYNLAVAPSSSPTAHDLVSDASGAWVAGQGNAGFIASDTCTDVATTTPPPAYIARNTIFRRSGLSISAWNLNNVSFTPLPNSLVTRYTSPILATGTNANLIDPFFTANTTTTSGPGASTYFIGARRGQNDNGWNLTSGWVNYLPETLTYVNDGDY